MESVSKQVIQQQLTFYKHLPVARIEEKIIFYYVDINTSIISQLLRGSSKMGKFPTQLGCLHC
jgi:hypothetical protein